MDLILKNKNNIMFFTITFLIVFMRFVYYGFNYYPQLDDYIQYYSYREFLGTVPEIIDKLGLLSARPFAGIMDITFWDYFFDGSMIFAVFLISIMYTSIAFIIKKAFENILNLGKLFIFIFLLLPLGFEGTYWISASSRIVVGMFLASLGILFFSLYCEKGKIRYIPLFIVIQFFSFGFYEQVIVFSITGTFLVAIGLYINSKISNESINNRIFLSFCTFINIIFFFVFILYFKDSSLYSSRLEIILPNEEGYFDIFLPDILNQFKEVFIYGNFYTIFKGFIRGLIIIFNNKSILYFIFLLVFCYFLSTYNKDIEIKNNIILNIVFSILFFVAPLTPFLIIGNPWFSFRGAVISFIGIAIFFDTLFNVLFKNINLRCFILGSIIFIFSVAGISEIHDYRNNSIIDKKISECYIEAIEDYNYTEDMKIGILNINEYNIKNSNYNFHEHISSTAGANWSFLGSCRYFAERFDIPNTFPLHTEGYMYMPYNSEENNIESFDSLLWYDNEKNKMFEVFFEKADDKNYKIYNKQNNLFYGTIIDNNGYGIFVFN